MVRTFRDQATGLRTLLTERTLRVLPVVGGISDVARASFIVGLGAAMSAYGASVVVLDASSGEVARLINVRARYELQHLLSGEKQFEQVVLAGPNDLGVLPARRGLDTLFQAGHGGNELFGAFAALADVPDLIVVNAPAERSLLTCTLVQDALLGREVVVLAGADSESITAAYLQIKSLVSKLRRTDFRVVVSGAQSAEAARRSFANLAQTAQNFLSARLSYGGFVPAGAAQDLALRRLALRSSEWHLPTYAYAWPTASATA
jgi:flagellar biosynthesis protein FlhG